MRKALILTTLVALLAVAAPPDSAVADTAKPGSDSTFLDMLNEANAIVLKSYPEAEFYEADLNLQMAGSPWQFVFNDPSTNPNSTVVLKNYMGQFQLPPQHVDSPWLEDRIIPLPIRLDLEQAEKLAKNAGWTGNIVYINLRWPLYPGANEPYYIFGIPAQGVHVFVGVYSHEVTTSPLSR